MSHKVITIKLSVDTEMKHAEIRKKLGELLADNESTLSEELEQFGYVGVADDTTISGAAYADVTIGVWDKKAMEEMTECIRDARSKASE